jgi:hypothetical protein
MAEEMQTTVVEATAESSEEQLTYEEWLLGVDHDLRVICNGSEGILGIQEEIELNRHGDYKLPDWRAEYEKGTEGGELAYKIAKELDIFDTGFAPWPWPDRTDPENIQDPTQSD